MAFAIICCVIIIKIFAEKLQFAKHVANVTNRGCMCLKKYAFLQKGKIGNRLLQPDALFVLYLLYEIIQIKPLPEA